MSIVENATIVYSKDNERKNKLNPSENKIRRDNFKKQEERPMA